MSIIEKLKRLEERIETHMNREQVVVTTEEMERLFGENFKEQYFEDDYGKLVLFFEEKGKIYGISYNEFRMDYVIFPQSNGRMYKEINENSISFYESMYEKSLRRTKVLDKVLNHKSIRLKKLFN